MRRRRVLARHRSFFVRRARKFTTQSTEEDQSSGKASPTPPPAPVLTFNDTLVARINRDSLFATWISMNALPLPCVADNASWDEKTDAFNAISKEYNFWRKNVHYAQPQSSLVQSPPAVRAGHASSTGSDKVDRLVLLLTVHCSLDTTQAQAIAHKHYQSADTCHETEIRSIKDIFKC